MDDPKKPDSDPEDLAAENARLTAEDERLKAEVEALQARDRASRHHVWLRVRKISTPILIALTCLSLVATTVAVWVNRTIWNEDKYIATVVPLGDDPAIIDSLATQITDQAFLALDVQNRVEEALTSIASSNEQVPEQITFLAGPITESLRKVIREQVVKFLQSDQFQEFWANANEQLHPKIVALLQGNYDELPNITVGREDVQLNLIPIVTQVLRDLVQKGLGSLNIDVTIPQIPENDAQAAVALLSRALGVTLPENFGQVTIMTSAQLDEYQQAANDLRSLAITLLIVTLVLAVLSIAVAPRRRRAVIWLGAGTVVALFLGRGFLRNLRDAMLDSIQSQEARNAAKAIFAQLGGSLKHTAAIVAWTAILIGVIAYLAGRPRWLAAALSWLKRLTAPQSGGSNLERSVAAHAEIARVGAGIVAVIWLFRTGIDWIPVIVIGGLFALFMWWVSSAQHKVHGRAGRSA